MNYMRKPVTFAQRLVKLLNEEVAPFAGVHIEAELDKRGEAYVVIGRRDLHMMPSGYVVGAGTCLSGKRDKKVIQYMMEGREKERKMRRNKK